MYIKLATNLLKKTFLFCLIIFCNLFSNAQLTYNFERINTDNGLPTNAIKGLQFDEKTRFLWVATESGIVRYNGHSFQNFGDTEKLAKLNGRIVFFEKAYNGLLYGKLIDETAFFIKENKAVIELPEKKLTTEYDYLNYKYKVFKNLTQFNKQDLDQNNLLFHDAIYTIIKHKMYRYKNGMLDSAKLEDISDRLFVLNNKLYKYTKEGIANLILDKESKLIINSESIDLNKKLGLEVEFSNLPLRIIQNMSNEPVYVVYGNSLFELVNNNNHFDINLITNQLPKNELIKYVQIDEVTKVIYIGTDNRGLIVGRPQYFKRILPNNAIEGISTSAYAQVLLNNGNIQINTGQVYGKSTLSGENIFYRPSETNTLISKDSILYYTNSEGMNEFDLIKKKLIGVYKNIHANRNNYIEIGDSIYSFSDRGIAVKSKMTSWHYRLRFNKTPFNFIFYSSIQINQNEVLTATTDGLYKYFIKENKFKLFYRDKANSNFRAIYNLNGYYLIGTYGGGLYMYRNGIIRKMPLDQDQYLNYAHCFIEDKKHRVWASTNKGLFMSPAKSLIDFWENGPGNIKFRYFGNLEGIDQLEMNGGCTPCAIQLKDGSLSFPGIDGLIQFNPLKLPDIYVQPKVYVDRLLINGKIVNVNKFISGLNSTTKDVEIQLGISGMLSKENIMLEYKIDKNDWVRMSVKNSIIKINNPGYGKHTISVQIRNTMVANWTNLDIPFEINVPWTLHPLMYVIYLLTIIGLVLLYTRFKTLIYQRRQKQLEFEVNAKTATLNNLNEYLVKRNQAKDHVIAIMNHDILTPLKYLHITAKNISDSKNINTIHFKDSINQIAKTTKELEYLTSNMLNWVKFDNIDSMPNKQNFDLNILVNDLIDFVQPFVDNKKIEFLNNVQGEVVIHNWPDTLRVLLYNLMVNSIHATSYGKISVSFEQTNNVQIISVADTGIGMKPSMIDYLTSGKVIEDGFEHHSKFKSGNGIGYQIIRNIIQLMDANIEIESVENKGTTVKLYFFD